MMIPKQLRTSLQKFRKNTTLYIAFSKTCAEELVKA